MTYDNENSALNFKIVLMIDHPGMDPARITAELGMKPRYHWKAGDARQTPVGTPLPGRRQQSYWAISEEVAGHRDFFTSVADWVARLEPSAAFLSEIVETGGSIYIGLQLSGKRNIGDVINWDALARIAALKIQLGVEVFPDMRDAAAS